MVENVYSGMQDSKKTGLTEGRKSPKNIRQIGYFTGGYRIYIEDYVYSFARWLAEQDYASPCAAILVGEFARSEYTRDIYISGCVVLSEWNDNCPSFSDSVWTNVYENIKEFFPEYEIVGWFYGGTGFGSELKNTLTKVHLEYFAGNERVLLLYDLLDKEEEIYRYEENGLEKQSGYYIYYEKNEEMQNYMILQKQGKNKREDVEDRAVKQMKSKLSGPNAQESDLTGGEEAEKEKGIYLRGMVSLAAILVLAVLLISNQKKMGGLEQTINRLISGSDSLTEEYGEEPVNIFEQPIRETFQQQKEDGKQDESGIDKDAADNSATPQLPEEKDAEKETKGNEDLTDKNDTQQNPDTSNPSGTEKEEKKDSDSSNENESGSLTGKEEKENETDSREENNAGQSADPSETDEKPESSEVIDTSSYRFYTVKSGDTLVRICMKLYGNLDYFELIKELNQITNENMIYVNQELLVP